MSVMKQSYETNRYKIIKLLGGKCRMCLEEKISLIEVDHIYGDGWEERSKYGSNERIFGFYLQNELEAFKRLQPLCKKCHKEKTFYSKKEDEVEIIPISTNINTKEKLFMDIMRGLDLPVEEKTLIQNLIKYGEFTEDEARKIIRRMLREAAIYEFRPAWYDIV